jgi:uncharacterized damage-inducible protein DinB
MVERRDELLNHYRESRKALMAAIEGLSDKELSEPTLDGWSVKDHLMHLATWDELRASEIERISAGHESLWRLTEPQVEVYNDLVYELRREATPAQAKWEIERSRDRLLSAIESATERGLDATLYGDPALRSGHEPEHVEWIRQWRAGR